MPTGGTAEEAARLAHWRAAQQSATGAPVPFSFVCQEQRHHGALPELGLSVEYEVIEPAGFAAVEWVVHLSAAGTQDTPILSDILALDARFALPRQHGCTVHWSRGSECRIDDFEPQCAPLNPTAHGPQEAWRGAGNPLVLESKSGRSSCGTLPFFNLVTDDGWGVIVAVGWTGDWRVRLWRDDDGSLRVTAGLKRTHLRLHPGERIRTPRMAVLCYEGDRERGQNQLRRLLLAHHNPLHRTGDSVAPISLATWGENQAERQLGKIAWLTEQQIAVDNYWIDAGWHGDAPYQSNSTVFNSVWWREVGNWWPNPLTYPDGLAPIGEAAAAAGQRFTLWFEPERIHTEGRLAHEHADWLLGPIGSNYLLDLGRPEVRQAITELISKLLSDGRVTCYRQDFNTDPAPFWEAADAPDRVGMTEIRHIEGLYAFWDALLDRHPGLLIDNCSSGGRRIDLETVSRSIPLWRSDFQCFPEYDPIGLQCQTYGLAPWVPLSTGSCDRPDDYLLLSATGVGLVFCTPPNPTGEPEGFLTPWQAFGADWLRHAAAVCERLRPYYLGDLYPLLAFSLAADALAAWQWHRPETGGGLLQVFRRPECPANGLDLRLRALDPAQTYRFTNVIDGTSFEASGAAAGDAGLPLTFTARPQALAWVYEPVA